MSKLIAALFGTALAAVGCSLGPTVSEENSAAKVVIGGPETCVFVRTIFDWRAVDDERIVIRETAGDDRAYLVVLVSPSFNLHTADSIAFADGNGDGRLCSFGGDAVLLPGTLGERRLIASIKRLTAAEVKALLGRTASPAAKPVAPAPAPG
ncbi:MAG: hypothetical protein IPJ52_07525 [Rhodocyclaceae bacterium]|nr:hypothetical protein [Rhodocyclaceae bacterium]MBK7814155.1 hypothetical protein [Rhodocyclaceae bacterium]